MNIFRFKIWIWWNMVMDVCCLLMNAKHASLHLKAWSAFCQKQLTTEQNEGRPKFSLILIFKKLMILSSINWVLFPRSLNPWRVLENVPVGGKVTRRNSTDLSWKYYCKRVNCIGGLGELSSAELWRLPLPGRTMAGWHGGRKMVHWDEWEKIYWKDKDFNFHHFWRLLFHILFWYSLICHDSFCAQLAFGSIKVSLCYLRNL